MILQHTERLPFIVTLSQAHHYYSDFILAWKRYSLWMRITVSWNSKPKHKFSKAKCLTEMWISSMKWYTKQTRVLLYSKKRKPILQRNVKLFISVLFVSSALDTCPAHIKIIGWKCYLTKMHLPICPENKFML